jgi:hypothetical protein
MGGKDVLYVRQEDTSDRHDPARIQKLLTETASMKFMDSANNHGLVSQGLSNIKKVPWTSLFLHVLHLSQMLQRK